MIITTGSSQVDVVEDHPITAVCVIDDIFVAFATSKGKIYKYDRNLRNSELIGSHRSVIHRLAVFRGKLISSSEAGRIKVWDLDSKERTLRIRPNSSVGPIYDFAIEDHFIYFGCSTQSASPLYKYDLETGDEVERSTHKRSHIRSIELIQLDSTRYFVVGSSSHGSESFDMRLNPMERLTSQETNAWSCPFALANPSTKRFACVMKKSDNTCFVEYSSEQAEELSVKYLSSKQKKFRVVGVAMNKDWWFVVTQIGVLLIGDAKEQPVSVPSHSEGMNGCIAIDGNTLFIGTDRGEIEVLNIKMEQEEEEDQEDQEEVAKL